MILVFREGKELHDRIAVVLSVRQALVPVRDIPALNVRGCGLEESVVLRRCLPLNGETYLSQGHGRRQPSRRFGLRPGEEWGHWSCLQKKEVPTSG